MEMTNEEIIRKYNESDNKRGYVQVLADLNGCERKDIVKILVDAGIPMPGFKPKAEIKDVSHETYVIPTEIREQLELDVEQISEQIDNLTKRQQVIINFLKGKEER